MRLAVISFTKPGSRLCGRLVKQMNMLGHDCRGYVQERFIESLFEIPGVYSVNEPLKTWTGERFPVVDGLVYIGAAGIAVRAIAPFVKDKEHDPAVVVMDEGGVYAISLLSGHLGGANELAQLVADITGATPVITTASDGRGMAAIDVWAKKRKLVIANLKDAKIIAAALLEEEPVGFYSDYPVAAIPDGLTQEKPCKEAVWITIRTVPEKTDSVAEFFSCSTTILRLLPQVLSVGVGCRKGIAGDRILEFITHVFEKEHLDLRSMEQLASIDIKEKELGLIQTAAKLQIPFVTYPADILETVEGSTASSGFVKKVTGTDNVCERAALAAAGTGAKLLVKKTVQSGITVAIAARPVTGL